MMRTKKPSEIEFRSSRMLYPGVREKLTALDAQAERIRHAGLTVKITYSERHPYQLPLVAFYFGREQVAQWLPQFSRLRLDKAHEPATTAKAQTAEWAVETVIDELNRRRQPGKFSPATDEREGRAKA